MWHHSCRHHRHNLMSEESDDRFRLGIDISEECDNLLRSSDQYRESILWSALSELIIKSLIDIIMKLGSMIIHKRLLTQRRRHVNIVDGHYYDH